MKKNLLSICGVLLAICCTVGVVSCDKAKVKNCTSADKPYYCSSAKACCGYRYNDGHGTCWETMDGCRSSGYACQTCHIEED